MRWRPWAAGVALIPVALYVASPWLATHLLPHILARSGVELRELVIGYPTLRGVAVERFALHARGVQIVGAGGRITYRLPQLWHGRVVEVSLDALTIHYGGDADVAEPEGGSVALPQFWQLIPADRVTVAALQLDSTAPAVTARGSLRFDADALRVHLDVNSPLLPIPLRFDTSTFPDGRLTLALHDAQVAHPLLELVGRPDVADGVVHVTAQLALADAPLHLLAAYAGATAASGSVAAQLSLTAPWPLGVDATWKVLDGTGQFTAELTGALEELPFVKARLAGELVLHDGQVDAVLATNSVVEAEVPGLALLFTPRAAPRLTATVDQPVTVAMSDGLWRVDDGMVVSGMKLRSPLSLRARGAWRADGASELVVQSMDGAPRLLARGAMLAGGGEPRLGVKGRAVLGGRSLTLAGTVLGMPDAAGEVAVDFDASMPWPDTSALDATNVIVEGQLRATVAGRFSRTRTFEAALTTDYALRAGHVTATVAPGAHFELPDDAVQVSTLAAVSIESDIAFRQIDVKPTEFKLALPAFELSEQSISLTDALVSLTGATRRDALLTVDLRARAQGGRDGLPVLVHARHNLETGVGEGSLTADWRWNKPLLATQLPRWRAIYDVDDGTLQLAMQSEWRTASVAPSLQAAGQLTLAASHAHYDDYLVSGLAVAAPFQFSDGSLVVGDSDVRMGSVDVGFPLTQIGLRLAVANDVAQIRELSGSVLGGSFSAEAFSYSLVRDDAQFALRLRGVALRELLALEGEDIEGDGVLDGVLPVTINADDVMVVDGRVAARAPGGTLHYRSGAAASMAKTGVGFVFQALEDFRYDVLDAKVALASGGNLELAVKLNGSNPAVEKGRPITFNLNLTESIPALLTSLRAAQGITDRIEGKLAR